jgi:hypothetical protein
VCVLSQKSAEHMGCRNFSSCTRPRAVTLESNDRIFFNICTHVHILYAFWDQRRSTSYCKLDLSRKDLLRKSRFGSVREV